ncbi:MAG: nuclear transport factor 2 family protein [Novosphingobium sp.]
MSEDNKRVALQFIEAMSTGDPELAAPCLAADGFTITKGHGKFAGRREAAVMIGMIGGFEALLPTGLRLSVHNVVAGGDQVVVEAEGDGLTAAGTAYRNQYCFVFRLDGGKIKQLNEYFCTAHADAVLWPLVEAAGT